MALNEEPLCPFYKIMTEISSRRGRITTGLCDCNPVPRGDGEVRLGCIHSGNLYACVRSNTVEDVGEKAADYVSREKEKLRKIEKVFA